MAPSAFAGWIAGFCRDKIIFEIYFERLYGKSFDNFENLFHKFRRKLVSTAYAEAINQSVECTAVIINIDELPAAWISPETDSETVILYLHGGGFVACSARTHRPLTAAFALQGL